MTGGFQSPGPAYLSSRSADVILSDVRPIKLVFEALHAINVLLDELLYTILSASRSLSTEKLKAGLLKVLPTALGKEALLEAEVELKAYWERTILPAPDLIESGRPKFDLQWSFELLRLKCEAYSTMNDTDEDADAEKRLNERMEVCTDTTPPSVSLLAPAALYLTAILESICEHVLSNVSRVAARDSSRTIATIQDVFTALCEDDSMYSTFRAMKAYDQIEALSKAQRPRRSKSFSRNSDRISSPTRTSSPHAELISLRESASTPARVRVSSESFKSSATTVIASPEPKTSMEKARAMKKFMTHSRSSSEKDAEITRTHSESGKSRGSAEFEDDDDLLHEFDELMRSGGTMKVSLTPDRLKTMEVYNKERTQRVNRRGTREASQASETVAENDVPTISQEPKRTPHGPSRPVLRHVDSIIESEEEHNQDSTPPTSYHTSATARTRQGSLSTISTRSVPSSTPRTRSISISNVPHPRYDDSLSRRAMQNKMPALPTNPSTPRGSSGADHLKHSFSMPARKRKVVRNLDSIDLDEVMGGSEDENDEAPARSVSNPTSNPVSKPNDLTPQKSRTPHVSQSARDLIAFLDEGPPEEPKISHSPSANASVISFESSKTKSGRFSRMMSRLTIGGSTERLNGRGSEDSPRTPRILGRRPSKNSLPPPAYMQQQSLSSKRSYPSVVVAPPPRPLAGPPSAPPMATSAPIPRSPRVVTPTLTVPVSPMISPSVSGTSSSQASAENTTSTVPSSIPPSPSSRRHSIRKAVPTFEDLAENTPPVPPVPTDSRTSSRNGSLKGSANGHVEGSALRFEGVDGARVVTPTLNTSLPPSVNGHRKSPAPKVEVDEEWNVFPTSPLCSPVGPRPERSKVENGSATRSTPEVRRQNSSSPKERTPVGPAMSPNDVIDLHRLLSVATTADECRLLIDMFFARNGFTCKAASDSSSSLPQAQNGAHAKLLSENDDLERSLVEFFLGGGDQQVEGTNHNHSAYLPLENGAARLSANLEESSTEATLVNVNA
ncbi:hypothetical protein AcW1_005045 [Taiwanofungus camphoratus]|nr:hypothetical protein AcW2_005945 [Antrodia cinnamomea]KAI0960564.1 hypothetical protein AcW1_005045 [Antrodia cinnamomea]